MGISEWAKAALVKEAVRKALESSGVNYLERVPVDGYEADFVFETPDGGKHLVETKAWGATGPDLIRAKNLAANLRTLRVAGSYVVIPNLATGRPMPGVVSVKELGALLKKTGPSEPPTSSEASTLPAKTTPSRIIFAAMPFAAKYDDVFFVAIRGAAKLVSSAAKRVDKEDYAGDVVERIRQRISQASAVVVDLSESRPNVLYEMGFAQASGRVVVPICSTPVGELPFDVRNLNILPYEPGQTSALRPRLSRRLRAVIDGERTT